MTCFVLPHDTRRRLSFALPLSFPPWQEGMASTCKQQLCHRLRRQLKRHTGLHVTLLCGDDAFPEPLLCIPQNVIHAKTDHSLWISAFPENIHTQAQPMPPSLPILVTNTHVHPKTMHVSTHAHRKPCTCKHTLPPSDLIPLQLIPAPKEAHMAGKMLQLLWATPVQR